ncbi:hypothetical protein GCM10009122_44110 [Fulvivirga kasyanovii]
MEKPKKTDSYLPTSNIKRKPEFKILKIRRLGVSAFNYDVCLDNKRVGAFRVLNDTLLFNRSHSGDTIFLSLNNKTKTCKFSGSGFDEIDIWGLTYNPRFERIKYEMLTQKTDNNIAFFDYNILHYQSGNPNNYVPWQRLLPFRISDKFIKERNIKELTVLFRLIKKRDTIEYTGFFQFNSFGQVVKIIGQTEKGEQESWLFERRDDKENSLRKMVYLNGNNSETYLYDEDEWPIDKWGQKIIKYGNTWKMLNDYLPSKLIIDENFAATEFLFGTGSQLQKMNLIEDEYKVGNITFEYNTKILSRVTYLIL